MTASARCIGHAPAATPCPDDWHIEGDPDDVRKAAEKAQRQGHAVLTSLTGRAG